MAITIGGLIEMGHLGCELIAGAEGLEREVRWAHVCELEDPVPWLEGGELVMTTGMAVPRPPRDQQCYLSRLAAIGAAGLAISKDMCAPPLTQALVDEAQRLAFPVLAVSIEVPFVAIARVVAMASGDESHRQLVRQLAVFDALRSASEALWDFPALFERLQRASGYRLFLSSTSGSAFLPGVPDFPDEQRHLLARPAGAPAHVADGYMISVPCGGRTAGYLLGLRSPGTDPAGLGALQHIATIAALQRATLEREREIERRRGSELFAELLAGHDPYGLARRLPTELARGEVMLTLISARDRDMAGSVLHNELTDLDLAHLLHTSEELALLTAADAPLEGVLCSAQATAAGSSRPFRLGDPIALAQRQAATALQLAIERSVRLVDGASVPEELDWLPREPATVSALVQRILGPLLEHDRLHEAKLVETLSVWLECGRRPGVVARRLGIHAHTLSYRLARIEELTGRDLRSPGATAEMWLALQAVEAVEWTHPSRAPEGPSNIMARDPRDDFPGTINNAELRPVV
jgi:PucR family transcriptional regulator, purine catabolism regulatory protein